eukprot:COSAG05_NODE_9164_length_643_cov_0.709559_1_plen_119_part_00
MAKRTIDAHLANEPEGDREARHPRPHAAAGEAVVGAARLDRLQHAGHGLSQEGRLSRRHGRLRDEIARLRDGRGVAVAGEATAGLGVDRNAGAHGHCTHGHCVQGTKKHTHTAWDEAE